MQILKFLKHYKKFINLYNYIENQQTYYEFKSKKINKIYTDNKGIITPLQKKQWESYNIQAETYNKILQLLKTFINTGKIE